MSAGGPVEPRVRQYLTRYAEPEARRHFDLPTYAHVLVLPAHDEDPSFVAALEACSSQERWLLILVVNATEAATATAHARNRVLIQRLGELSKRQRPLAAGGWLGWLELGRFDVLLVNRGAPGLFLPERTGVGLARKIGADIALALKTQGRVLARGFGCTDADAELPANYFSAGESAISDAAVAVFPFLHVPHPDENVTIATLAYELSLRYFVLGLDYAGSAYAYQSLGSVLYLEFSAYAQVRGFPKRLAGEDFYLLSKLAKIGHVRRLPAPLVQIQARLSERVPFGTGPRVTRLLADAEQGTSLHLYDPRCFEVLKRVLVCFADFARHPDPARTRAALEALAEGPALHQYFDGLDLTRALEQAASQTTHPKQRLRRLLTWFDSLKTLRLIHALCDSHYPMRKWRSAIREAPFMNVSALPRASLPPTSELGMGWHGAPLSVILQHVRALELELSPFVGVARL